MSTSGIPIFRLALALLVAGCAGGVSRDEVARSRSPDAPGGGMLYNRGRSPSRPPSTPSGGAAGETGAVATPRDSTWVEVRGPTLVAFWPAHAQAVIDSDGDDATALDDFGYHLASAESALRALGVRVVSLEGPRFHLVAGGRTTEFVVPRDSADLGYYLIAPGRAPAIAYGVLTDADLVGFAREYLTTRPPSPAEIQ
ncbi:MAG TPA: hypothetical protein VJT67_11895 [Longimicrobiaceae bacterium]|nr:hypothetical protein [Longimicrobiaceae bacterium]